MLGRGQLDQFETEGYLHVPGVLDPAAFSPVHDEYSEMLRERANAWRRAGRLSGGEEFSGLGFEEHVLALADLPGFDRALLPRLDLTLPYRPFSFVREDSEFHVGSGPLGLLAHPQVLDVVQSLLGPRITASPNMHCRIKLPVATEAGGINSQVSESAFGATGWHQDALTMMPESDPAPVVTCWIPMGDVSEHDGCLQVVPGAHRNPLLLPYPLSADTVRRLADAAVPVPARLGDVVLLHKRIPHASLPNDSDRLRWSFDFRYRPSEAPSDRPWFPSVQVRTGDPSFRPIDGTQWRALWHQARTDLSAWTQPMPGRPEFAMMIAESYARRWGNGAL